MIETVEFKSISEYFYDEKKGLKNHTERVIDMNDERFQTLFRAWKEKKYPLIRINQGDMVTTREYAAEEINDDKMYSFLRQVRHICIWNDLMIITWDHPIKEVLENE